MKLTIKIAFVCYLLVALMGATMGIRYLIADEIRPHHLEIIGVTTWEAVEPGFRVMLLMLMKGAGLGYLTTAVAACFLLFGPFRKGEAWSRWGLLVISMIQLGGRLVNVLIMKSNSSASAPVELLAIAIALVVIGFIFSVNTGDKKHLVEKEGNKSKYSRIAFVCYLLVALMATITGVIYCTADQIMPYHMDAVGVSSWEAIESGYQFMLLTYMRGAGLGFLTAAVAICILLFVPFRKGDSWSRWGLLVVSLTHTVVMLWIVLQVRLNTPGSPPLAPLVIAVALTVIGFGLSFFHARSRLTNPDHLPSDLPIQRE